ncbi:hypothetical protein JOF53_002319 [Crossiella equi]|uniref:DUF2550 domain-containing protein n=1 Tax=Crossiella equi TaxID=130796 RepID=A0ABS5AAX0_9PSEU|nr:hypothetical protein [Crossiella equi]MBP2473447.1 hypothetical protein [Crossiella equi]
MLELGSVRLRYFVRGRRVDGSRRNGEHGGGGELPGADGADGCLELVFLLVLNALWLGVALLVSWLARALNRAYRRRTARVHGKPGQTGVAFADAANQREDVYLVWSDSRLALVFARPRWIEVLWTGEELPEWRGSTLRWADGSRVTLPRHALR